MKKPFIKRAPILLAPVSLATAVAAGSAHAQSSVTVYGRIDLSVSKPSGTEAKGIENGSSSRLGFRGVEDLGGGLRAFFNIEHRFNADTGMQTATRFWHASSIVGLQGPFGQINLGRAFTSAYVAGMLPSDPFGHTTIASMLESGGGGITPVRNDSAIRWIFDRAGFTVRAEVAEGTDAINNTPDRPVSLGLSYEGGPLYVGYGYDNPGGTNDVWHAVSATYKLGQFKLFGGFGTGKTNADLTRRGLTLGASMQVDVGELRVAHGRLEQRDPDIDLVEKTAVGYYYNLSKRTWLYGNLTHDRKATTSKTGYQAGIAHAF